MEIKIYLAKIDERGSYKTAMNFKNVRETLLDEIKKACSVFMLFSTAAMQMSGSGSNI